MTTTQLLKMDVNDFVARLLESTLNQKPHDVKCEFSSTPWEVAKIMNTMWVKKESN